MADENSILAVATDDGSLSGILAVKPSSELFWELTFAWVAPQSRRSGIAATLCEMITGAASALGISEITASVTDDNEEDVLPFLLAMHFEEEYRTGIYRFSLKNILPVLETLRTKRGKHVSPLSSVTKGQWNALRNLISGKKAENGLQDGEDLYIVPKEIDNYESEYSFLWLSDDKRPGGCILVKGLSDSLLVDYLVAIDDSAGIRTAELLISAADAVKETEGEDTVICLHAFNPTAYRMTKKLLGGSEPEKISDAVYLTRKL
ncbi:MAG: GNAT family N-acetyltransferase [Lachnospiraceae bacterium]|nr:GNAT family N-acetyltransferase [Lachnospiraceae bacterium]